MAHVISDVIAVMYMAVGHHTRRCVNSNFLSLSLSLSLSCTRTPFSFLLVVVGVGGGDVVFFLVFFFGELILSLWRPNDGRCESSGAALSTCSPNIGS